MYKIVKTARSAWFFWAVFMVAIVGIFAFPLAAQEKGAQLKINVTAKCDGEDAVFEILNEGELWPAMAKISVYRTDSKTLLTSRSMRMAAGQKMAYKAKGSTEGKTDVGLWVEPQWYKRAFVFDAIIACD